MLLKGEKAIPTKKHHYWSYIQVNPGQQISSYTQNYLMLKSKKMFPIFITSYPNIIIARDVGLSRHDLQSFLS